MISSKVTDQHAGRHHSSRHDGKKESKQPSKSCYAATTHRPPAQKKQRNRHPAITKRTTLDVRAPHKQQAPHCRRLLWFGDRSERTPAPLALRPSVLARVKVSLDSNARRSMRNPSFHDYKKLSKPLHSSARPMTVGLGSPAPNDLCDPTSHVAAFHAHDKARAELKLRFRSAIGSGRAASRARSLTSAAQVTSEQLGREAQARRAEPHPRARPDERLPAVHSPHSLRSAFASHSDADMTA
eukprot:scaffold602_cov298-Pinguiococcus_pyrenoidosus.AAC.38